ncbi:MAG: biotin synthase BioB [Chitinispirillales bacterium]|jgi:biotin synthase|nr:biotin synthase BioB [Chitinispirillales bacterium]
MKYFKEAQKLFEKAVGSGIDEEEMRIVAKWPLDKVSLLFSAADQVRRLFFKNKVDPCTLMNIKSGGCGEDCAFCSQSNHNSANINVQSLSNPKEIGRRCKEAWSKGYPFCVVSSGKKLEAAEFETVCKALSECKGSGEKHASLGILSDDELKALFKAGVSFYNHNLETSRSYFNNIVTTHTYDDRFDTVMRVKMSGMRVCSGGIFGMGESWEHRIELCVDLRNLGVNIVPINFLNAILGTRVEPLKESPLELLKIVAMFRLAMPNVTIKVSGGREANLGSLQNLIFYAGANGYVTGGYLTTPGAGFEADEQMIAALGLKNRSRGSRSESQAV